MVYTDSGADDVNNKMKRLISRPVADIASMITERIHEVNPNGIKSPRFHILLGLLDAVAKEGRILVSSSLIVELTVACSNDVHNVLPPDAAYLIGRIGFGIFGVDRLGKAR